MESLAKKLKVIDISQRLKKNIITYDQAISEIKSLETNKEYVCCEKNRFKNC